MKRQKYLNNKDMLKEIHKSKLSFWRSLDDEYCRFDVIVEDIEDIRRAKHIGTDLKELESEYGFKRTKDKLKPSAVEYINYLPTLDNEELLAHIYVRHFGDMYGWQMNKKRLTYTTGKMYDFEDVEILKAKVRALLNDDMAEEANICFKYATKLFEELNNEWSLGNPYRNSG